MTTADEIKRRFHRSVQDYAATHGTPTWALSGDEWGRANLEAAERLAQHILNLPDDDPRFARIADAYTTQGWGADRFPTGILDGWLANLGGSGGSGIPNDPDEFVTGWVDAERHSVLRASG
jgi:hypothetical protein